MTPEEVAALVRAAWKAFTRVLCSLNWHRWGVWGQTFPHGYHHYQNRTCARCSMIRQRCAGYKPFGS